jgi:hypothetical protein
MMDLEKGIDSGEEEMEPESLEKIDAGLPVTQPNDPLSGGHFSSGTSKAPPGPSREGSGISVLFISALEMAHRKHTRLVVESNSPIPNGMTTVGGAKTRFLFCKIGHSG